jgi:selenocysteine-specific elongation factor
MEYVLIGTAGHVDHGKSTLIKALSGIDPDRLKEEKEREMTIDIGFANFLLPSGRCAQVIDVPGHERFIKNMLTGVNTIDLVLFLIDAKEGVKPQTIEHFDILKLLDIKTGIIVLNKIDLVTPERLIEATQQVSELVQNSFLAQAPILSVSALTGAGIQELIQSIDRLAIGIQSHNKDLPVRLPIDRVFTMTGSGTVITGTLVSGVLKVGDTLDILPQKESVRIRQIQSYGGKTESATAGQRVGINLAGIKTTDLIRGNVLATPGYLKPDYIFDAYIKLVSHLEHPLKNNTRVRLHIGTGEFLGRIILLDKEKLEAGESGLIQFRSEVPLTVVKGERFIIRLYAPMVTLGGGRILTPQALKHKRFDETVIKELNTLASANPRESISQVLKMSGYKSLLSNELLNKVNLPSAQIDTFIKELILAGEVVQISHENTRFMHAHNLQTLKDEIIQKLEAVYKAQPLRLNIPITEIKPRLFKAGVTQEVWDQALSDLVKAKKVDIVNDTLRITQHAVQLTPEQLKLKDKIEALYLKNLFNTPSIDEVVQTLQLKPKNAQDIIKTLKEIGLLVRLPDEIILHQSAISEASKIIKDYLSQHPNIKAGDFSKLLKTSRKYAIPLLEHLDSIKLTKRVGDVRVLCSN